MALNQVFKNAVKTVFQVFSSLVHEAVYKAITDDGFETPTETLIPVDLILDSFAERDVQFLSFSNLIQPTDAKGLVRGEQLISTKVSTSDVVVVGDDTYAIIAFNTDPAEALYTLLLRKV